LTDLRPDVNSNPTVLVPRMSVTISSIFSTCVRSMLLRPTAFDTTSSPSSHSLRRPDTHASSVSRTITTPAVTSAGVCPANNATMPPTAAPNTTATPNDTQPRRRALETSVRLSGTRWGALFSVTATDPCSGR
jgi:hypothetical protein